jgi:riboflavin synthase
MFTGLIEELGSVRAIIRDSGGATLTINASLALEGVAPGDSIAVDGVCLTVTGFDETSFTVGLAPETMRRTSLGDLEAGDAVALERAATPTTRMGGHYVQGHVDATGLVREKRQDGDALWFAVTAPRELMRYIAVKGYVAIDGASLTVCNVGDDWFDVTLIAYSQQKLALPKKRVGARVNLEVDILAKYVERIVAARSLEHA